MSELKRISIFILYDEDSADFDWVRAWLEKWAGSVIVLITVLAVGSIFGIWKYHKQQ